LQYFPEKYLGTWLFILHNISQKYSLHIFISIYSSPLACHADHTSHITNAADRCGSSHAFAYLTQACAY